MGDGDGDGDGDEWQVMVMSDGQWQGVMSDGQ